MKNNSDFKENCNFCFCNGHTFSEIKNTPVEELYYEKAHDLADVENKKYNVSVYLGVYDNEIQLTYSVHNGNDFDNEFENVACEKLEIDKIESEVDLKNVMEDMLEDFYFSEKELVNNMYKDNNQNLLEEGEVL